MRSGLRRPYSLESSDDENLAYRDSIALLPERVCCAIESNTSNFDRYLEKNARNQGLVAARPPEHMSRTSLLELVAPT